MNRHTFISRLVPIAHLTATAVLSLMILGTFMRVGWNSYDRARLADMVHGRAHRPFVYRVLTPTLIRGVMRLMPDTAKQTLRDWAAQEKPSALLSKWQLDASIIVEAAAVCLVLWLALIAFSYALLGLFRTFYGCNDLFLRIAALAGLAGLPPFFRYYSYIYDFPTITLFTVGLILLARRRWPLFLAVFALASLSKETSILLTVIFLIHYRHDLPRNHYLGLAAAQLALFVVIKVGLAVAFADRPGGFVESHIVHNMLLKPYDFGQFTAFILIAIAIAHDWRSKPLFLRHALWILPILFVLTFFLGLIDEYRDFYEAYPICLALILPSVARLK